MPGTDSRRCSAMGELDPAVFAKEALAGRDAFLVSNRGLRELVKRMEPFSPKINEAACFYAQRMAALVKEFADSGITMFELFGIVRERYCECRNMLKFEADQTADATRFCRVCKIWRDCASLASKKQDVLFLFSGCLNQINDLLADVEPADDIYFTIDDQNRMIESYASASDAMIWLKSRLGLLDVPEVVELPGVMKELGCLSREQRARKTLFVGDEQHALFSASVFLLRKDVFIPNVWCTESLAGWAKVKVSECFSLRELYDHYRIKFAIDSVTGIDSIGRDLGYAHAEIFSYLLGCDILGRVERLENAAFKGFQVVLSSHERTEDAEEAVSRCKEITQAWRRLQELLDIAGVSFQELFGKDYASKSYLIENLDHIADQVEYGGLDEWLGESCITVIKGSAFISQQKKSEESIAPLPVLTTEAQKRAKRTRNPRGKAAASSQRITLTNKNEGYLRIEKGGTYIEWQLSKHKEKDGAELSCVLTNGKAWRFLEELMRRGEFCCSKAHYNAFENALLHKARNNEVVAGGKTKAALFLEQIVGVEDNYAFWKECDQTYGRKPGVNRKLCRVFLKNFSAT